MRMALEMVKGGTMRRTKWTMSLSKHWKLHVKRERWKKRSLRCELLSKFQVIVMAR